MSGAVQVRPVSVADAIDVAVSRQAVFCFLHRIGRAHIPLAGHPRRAETVRRRCGKGIPELAAAKILRYIVVSGIAARAFRMQGDLAKRERGPSGKALLLVPRAIAKLRCAIESVLGQGFRHLAVDQVDGAVQRIAAIDRRSRTAQHLDRVQKQWVCRYRMVGGDR